tara:strand:+ start:335 stop:1885 length:1551 start_codon:yes stop_codon:yes gene_type:complete
MAFTKVTGTLVDIGDLDLTNVGQIQLDSIAGDADANTSITFSGSDVITIATGGTTALTVDANQKLTANSGVVVDELTIDGDTITATDDFIIDAVGDITLDADGGDIIFKDGGTSVGKLDLTGGFAIKSEVSDADFFIQGNDGGSAITALTLDMSEAGAATFNSTIITGGITIDGSNSTITDSSDFGIVSGGDLTVDVTGDIILDAGGGDWTFRDDSTVIGSLANMNSGDFRIRSHVSDKDIFFTINDAGTVREVARFDASDYGKLQLGGTVANFGDLNVTGQNNGASQIDLYSSAGSGSLGQANIIFSSDSSSDHLSMAEIRMEQPTGDEAARKGQIKFRVSDNGGPADAMLIENNKIITTYGDLKITNDIIMLNNGRGISFAADTEDEVGAGSVGSETLHDYEEGTWTPGNNGTAFSTAYGTYTKIGNKVFCQFRVIQGSGGGSTGDWTGLPFTIRNSSTLGTGGGVVGYHNAAQETWSVSTENVNTTTFSIRRGPYQKQLPAGDTMWGTMNYLV